MSRAARGWVVEVEGVRYGVLASSASAALTLARPYCPVERLATRGPLPAPYVRVMRQRRCVLHELKNLQKEALSRGVALPKFRAQTSSRSIVQQPTSQEAVMAKAKQGKAKTAKAAAAPKAEQKYAVNKKADYAVREGTMSDKFVQALPGGKFTKAVAVAATQKAVKTAERASLFFNYFKGKGVIVAA